MMMMRTITNELLMAKRFNQNKSQQLHNDYHVNIVSEKKIQFSFYSP